MVDLANSGDDLQRERLSLERERLRLERQKLAVDVLLKKRELVERRGKPLKELLTNPVSLVIVGGFITLMTTIITTSYTASENRRSEDLRAAIARDNAEQALQAELIKKFVEAPKSDTVRENLRFLVDAGLLSKYAEGITRYLKENPDSAPAVGATGVGVPSRHFEMQAPELMRRLMADFGLTDFQAAGVVGNIAFETVGFRLLQEVAPLTGGRGGFGYLMWTGPKRASFMKFATDKGFDPTTMDANYGFLKQELETVERNAVTSLKITTTIEDATRTFELRVVRAGVKQHDNRIVWARRALEALPRAAEAAPN